MGQAKKRSGRACAALLVASALLAGCAGMPVDAREMLQEPKNCANPQQDIQVLEAGRPGGFKRFTQGVQGVAPPMVVLSLLRDVVGKPYRSIYLDHWRVAFGSYSRQIDERVAELEECG